MTSETKEEEKKKRTRKIQQYLQKHKRRIGLICSAALSVTLLGVVPPGSANVACDDPSIRLPYLPDTISVGLLLGVGIFIPFITMTVFEWLVPPSSHSSRPSLNQSIKRSYSYFGDLFVGGLFMFVINDLAKIFTSEPRPSFWNSCSPNISTEQCQQQFVSISWRDCTNPLNLSHGRLVDTMKSFPSGHASVSTYSALFMIVYIKQRVWNKGPWPVALCLQLMWGVWAYICCQSRIWDNRHHWWDVLAGILLGAFGTFLTLTYLSNWFIVDESKSKEGSPVPTKNSETERT